MSVSTITPRRSKYCDAIGIAMRQLGHATNAEILELLSKNYPGISATTVHRATARMALRGELAMAPSDPTGAMRYDSNVSSHDHFMCERCGRLRDVDMPRELVQILKTQLDGCSVDGNMTLTGRCHRCKKRSEHE